VAEGEQSFSKLKHIKFYDESRPSQSFSVNTHRKWDFGVAELDDITDEFKKKEVPLQFSASCFYLFFSSYLQNFESL
jgi:hypothetical protein